MSTQPSRASSPPPSRSPWRREVHRRRFGVWAADLPLGQRILAGGQPMVVAGDLLPPERLEELPVRS